MSRIRAILVFMILPLALTAQPRLDSIEKSSLARYLNEIIDSGYADGMNYYTYSHSGDIDSTITIWTEDGIIQRFTIMLSYDFVRGTPDSSSAYITTVRDELFCKQLAIEMEPFFTRINIGVIHLRGKMDEAYKAWTSYADVRISTDNCSLNMYHRDEYLYIELSY